MASKKSSRLLMGSDPATAYGGKYDVREGEWLVLMRRVLEGKITDKKLVSKIRAGFNSEFGPKALSELKADIGE